jgi:hypothetical protein
MMNQGKCPVNFGSRLISRSWLCGLLVLALARAALAADPGYTNNTYLSYTVPPQNLPVIDATNFVNNNWFEVTFTSTKGGLNGNAETFETEDTVNYINIGTMVANSSYLTNGSSLILSASPGCGFQFDDNPFNSSYHNMAGSFYNPGNIRANSAVDLGIYSLLVSTIGKCLVNATNIVVPGTIDVGENSLMQLTGKSVDLTRARLTVEGFGMMSALDYGVGIDTNQDWIPSYDLGLNYALSSLFVTTMGYQIMYLTNSTPYFLVANPSSNSVIVRAIFIQNQPTNNVTAKVFWGQAPFPTTFGCNGTGGAFNIEWDGTYVDASTGQTITKYLYLNDDDVCGSQNPAVLGGIPVNFTFYESNQELFLGAPDTPNYPGGVFIPYGAVVTNTYSYSSVQFIPTTAITNNPTTQKNVTNYLSQVLPGRIQVSADNSMDLSLAQISGQNYLSLRSPVQFNGSVGAKIFSPYSDINLGVTNGFMTVTNLMEPSVPDWNGGVQCWSARWLAYITNSSVSVTNGVATTNFFTVTNDFRVLLVNSSLSPITPSEIQDLKFHAATNLVISDVFNILRSLSIDAQSLMLTTNGPNPASPDGELNLQANGMVWSSSLPNLRNLTNSGAIRVANLNAVNFGSAASPYGAFINHGLVNDYGAIIYATNFESDGWFSNSVLGSFVLQSQTATFTNGWLFAGGDVSITATTGSLVASNLVLQAGRSLTLTATNLLTDTGITNGNVWTVGASAISTIDSGLNLPLLPAGGDLLGTTITLYVPAGVNVSSVWAATNHGVASAGYTNNVAIGRLILDSQGSLQLPPPNTEFTFNGVGVSNAIYVDDLELRDWATNRDAVGNLTELNINNNMVIYYAQARINGASVARKLDHKNNGHLRWVPAYAGYFSSTNLVYGGVTNAFNAALAQDQQIDSNGDGIPNGSEQMPFTTNILSPSQINLTYLFTNLPPLTVVLTWQAVPPALNYVCYSPDLINWQVLTVVTNYTLNYAGDFSGYDNSTNSGLPNTVMTNTVSLPVAGTGGNYKIGEVPWLTYPLSP